MEKILIAVFFLAMGTYLTRLIPLVLTLKRQQAFQTPRKIIQQLLEYIGPSLIAALFVISITPLTVNVSFHDGFRVGLALLAVLGSHFAWKNPGISVLVGIAAYAGAQML